MPLTRSPGRTTAATKNIALLGGLCFFLSVVEYMIPKPLPFIRLGLANLPLLLALDTMPFSSFALLVCLKVFGQALISGTLFSYVFLFSLGGTGVSALLMYALRRGLGKERISLIGISSAGALASNGVQLVLAYYFVFGASVRYAAAPVLALGIVTGTILGFFSEYFIGRSVWYGQFGEPDAIIITQRRRDAEVNNDITSSLRSLPPSRPLRETLFNNFFTPNELAIAGLCMIPALLLNPDTNTRVIQFLFFLFLAWLSGKKINLLITVSVMLTIIFFNLLVPYGEILFSIGPFAVTSGALLAGIRRAVTLQGLMMLSRCCIRQDISLPGFFGELAGESFRIFSRLTEEKQLLKRRNWAEALDELLIDLSGIYPESENDTASATEEKNKSRKVPPSRLGPRLVLAAIVILAWLPVIGCLTFILKIWNNIFF